MKILEDNWFCFDSKTSLSKKLAQEILKIAELSILKNNSFNIVLTGGKSVSSLYNVFSKSNSDWSKWHIYLSDERFLPKGHKDRNDRLINEIWLKRSLIPRSNIHFIQVELGLQESQKKYENLLRKIKKFDVVLLSIGEDGHISSLFPNCTYPKNQNVVIEKNSPKSPKERISMSYEKLNKAHHVFKIIMGESKRSIVEMLLQGKFFPVNVINGEMTKVFIHNNAIIEKYK